MRVVVDQFFVRGAQRCQHSSLRQLDVKRFHSNRGIAFKVSVHHEKYYFRDGNVIFLVSLI